MVAGAFVGSRLSHGAGLWATLAPHHRRLEATDTAPLWRRAGYTLVTDYLGQWLALLQ